jgi:hypothetical protein
MKRIYIEDCEIFNEDTEITFRLNPKDIYLLFLFDTDNKNCFLYRYGTPNQNVLFKNLQILFQTNHQKYIENSFPIDDEKYYQLLEMNINIFKRYYKNNFLKHINLEEMII